MEKEDKIIKALLNDEFIEKAPDGFTGRVMHTIELAELQKDHSYKADWLYLLIIAGSVFFAPGYYRFYRQFIYKPIFLCISGICY